MTVASILAGSGIWIIYFWRSTPTLIPYSTSVGESFSLNLTTNLAICLIWMTYFDYFSSLMILLHLATWSGCSVAAFESEAKFHCAGSDIPVSSYLIPNLFEWCTCQFIDFFNHLSVFLFEFFNRFCIRTHSISFKEINFSLIERNVSLLFFLFCHYF